MSARWWLRGGTGDFRGRGRESSRSLWRSEALERPPALCPPRPSPEPGAGDPASLRLSPGDARGDRRAGCSPAEGPGPRLWGLRWRRGRASWGARAFVCAPTRSRPPGFLAPAAFTCPELEFFVWGGARPAEAVPRVSAEAVPRVWPSQTKRAVTAAHGRDYSPQESECWPCHSPCRAYPSTGTLNLRPGTSHLYFGLE